MTRTINKLVCPVFTVLLVVSGQMLLSACSMKDDFGRIQNSQLRENAGDVVGSIQEHTGLFSRDAAYHIPFTGDEIRLRRTLKHFSRSFFKKPTLRRPLKTQTFPAHRTAESFREYIIHNIRSDMRRLSHFDEAVEAVIRQDMQRYEVVASSFDVKENDSRFIRVRIRENRAVTMRIMKLIDRRIADYDQAIEYAGLQYPRDKLRPLHPAMEKLRARNGVLKARFESYVFSHSAKGQLNQFDDYQRSRR